MSDLLKIPLLAIAVLCALLVQSATAVPTTMIDDYVGADSHAHGDVIGSPRHFQISSMDVSLTGSQLGVSILTTFAGKGDDGLFSAYTAGGTGIGYSDLFLSSDWSPHGTAPYTGDDASNGTTWSHGFSLDDRYMNEGSSGTGTLYSLTGDNADILLTQSFMTGATYRSGQEVAVDRSNSNNTAIAGTSNWNIDAANDRVNFMIDLTGTDLLLGDTIALHWGFTCMNDAIEGAYSVPEPGVLALLATGLIGITGITSARKKRPFSA